MKKLSILFVSVFVAILFSSCTEKPIKVVFNEYLDDCVKDFLEVSNIDLYHEHVDPDGVALKGASVCSNHIEVTSKNLDTLFIIARYYKLKAEVYHHTYKDEIPHRYSDTSYYYIEEVSLSKDGKITYPSVKIPYFYVPVKDENGNFTDENNYWRVKEVEDLKEIFIDSTTIYNTLVSAIKKLDKNIVIEPIPFSITE